MKKKERPRETWTKAESRYRTGSDELCKTENKGSSIEPQESKSRYNHVAQKVWNNGIPTDNCAEFIYTPDEV